MPESAPRNFRIAREIARQDILFAVARVPNSGRLLVASSETKVIDIDTAQATPQPRDMANHGRYVTSVRLAGNNIISGGYDGRLIWWDLERNREIRTIDAHSRWIRNLAVSPDGSKIASVADDMVCRLWNVGSGERIREFQGGHEQRTPSGFQSMLYVCTFSADGRKLATADRVGHIVVWDVDSGRQLTTMEAPGLYTWDPVQRIRSIGGIRGLAFSPDGTHLAAGGVGQIGNVDSLDGPSRVEIFNIERRERVHEFTGAQRGLINRLQYHPQGNWLFGVGGGGNGFYLFYDVGRRAMIHQGNLPMHTHDAVFNEDFTSLYAVGHNKIVVAELRG